MLFEKQIPLAVEILRAGGVVAFRTETVYGLGATVANADKIFEAKGRPSEKALVWQFASVKDMVRYFNEKTPAPEGHPLYERGKITEREIGLLKKYRVGFTLVLGNGVAVRIPHDRVAKRILRGVGEPLVVTSANMSGMPAAVTHEEVEAELAERIEAIVMSGRAKYGVASTVCKINGEKLEILRQGFAKVREMWNN